MKLCWAILCMCTTWKVLCSSKTRKFLQEMFVTSTRKYLFVLALHEDGEPEIWTLLPLGTKQ